MGTLFRLSLALGILAPFALANANGADSTAPPFRRSERHKGNCRIHITYLKNTGETTTKDFFLDTPSRKECEQAAKLHETNFAPGAVTKKTVTFVWKGK